MSLNWIDIVNIIALKAFILSIGSSEIFFIIKGTAPKHLQ